MIRYILLDLDGTLLPMDQDVFVKSYLKLLAAKMAPHGYEPKALVDAVWAGTGAMVENDGSCKNEDAFWTKYTSIMGEKVLKDKPLLEEFYAVDFARAKEYCGFNPDAAATVKALKAAGFTLALATNPLFPAVATLQRIRWAGLDPEDFKLITTYESDSFCKPNPSYYIDILLRLGAAPEECVMVGNDAEEDMVPETLGMHVFLLTDCLINRRGDDISRYPSGSFAELLEFIKGLCS